MYHDDTVQYYTITRMLYYVDIICYVACASSVSTATRNSSFADGANPFHELESGGTNHLSNATCPIRASVVLCYGINYLSYTAN